MKNSRLQVLTGTHVSAEMVLEEGGGIKSGIYFIHIAPGGWMLEDRDQRDIWLRESLQNNWYELYKTSHER